MSTDARKKELIESLLRQRGVDPTSLPIGPRSADDGPAPLSFAQERLWIVERFAPGRPTYNEAYEVRLRGRLDPAALAATLNELSRRHAALRTRFAVQGGAAVQVIGEPGLPMPVMDLSGLPEALRAAEADRRSREEAEIPFDLERGPVARACLVRLGEEDHRLLLVLHHIVSDATSMEILVTELMEIHRAFARGEASPLPEPRLQYADFAGWQREKQVSSLEKQLAHWKERLAGAPTVLELPSDRPRSEQPRGRGDSLAAALHRDLSRAVRELAQSHGATLFMTLLSAFDALLYRYTGRQDLLVGTPIAGRTRAEVERVVGFFVNTLVLRADLAGDPTFAELLARNRRTVLAAYDHQDVPFGRLVEELRPERAASHAPLIQVMFLLQKQGVVVEEQGLSFEMRRVETGTAKFDLTFLVWDTAERIVCGVEYDSDLFLPATMARLLEHFQALLEAVTADPGIQLSQLGILTAAERQQLLAEWHDAALARPRACVHELFAARAASAPDAPALVFEGRTTSYGELNAAANRLARRLLALGVRTDELVGICLEPSPDLMVAVLGILKAGSAYVPLDPGQPAERLGWLLGDTGLRIVLTDNALAARLPESGARVLRLDEERETLAAMSSEDPELRALPESLAYQIYTSGSTGRPKGVMVPHAGLVNLALSFAESWRLGPGDRMLLLHSLAFDASVGDLFPPLVSGAALVLHRTPQALLGRDLEPYLERQGITCVELAAAFWQQWTEDLAARNQAPPSSLRVAVVGGEAVTLDRVRTWYRLLAGRPFRFLNHYGPTESTVCASSFKVDEGEEELDFPRLPIGRSLPNVRLCLLDPDLQQVPAGVPGELCIGGIGVARGYLGQPGITAERFIPDPFAGPEERGARLYRTGDLVRRLPDGNLDFLGRVDQQVKIRGYRIEPGEIEVALAEHPALRESVVVARADEPGPKRLVAYVVAGSEPAPAAADLRTFLKGKLPAHMVPEAFVFLDRLPLNANGKVDRRALPRPVFDREAGLVAPESELQRQIAEVWRELLGLERIGLHDNFFDIGGHSLLLIRMEGRLRDVLKRPVEVIELFRHPTVASLAEHLEGGSRPAQSSAWTSDLRERPRGREIAIVGMAGRFPGARDVEQLWRNLCAGVESIRFFTDEELRAAGIPDESLGERFYVKAKGVLDDVDSFDAGFFGFSPREAEILDPQHRHFLECAWETLENAGCDPERYHGLIGVFASAGRNSYFTSNLMGNPAALRSVGMIQMMMGNDRDFLPTRASYKLNLKGPSVIVQTACSSSLVAVHMACRSLLDGECDLALAGGVTISVPQVTGYFHEEGGIFSNDGHCRAFDAKAKGTVPGSGVALVALKRLESALADGDFIHAVIKSTAINNDGSVKIGYTAPGPEGQVRVIREAIARAGVDAETITYVETHGTGTLLGDLIEVSALKDAFRPLTSKPAFCAIGSLKTNVGHMDTAAGVGGLIKAALALRHRSIPPSLHFQEANPKLDMIGSPFFVNASLREWQPEGGPLRAGVSSFGLGGTNAHAILEEAPPLPPAAPSRPWQLFVLSARTASSLERSVQRLSAYLENRPELELADVAHTLQTGRRAFEQRAAFVARDREGALAALQAGGRGILRSEHEGPEPPVVFLFPGGGAQRPNMGIDLYRHEPVFRAALDRTIGLMRPLLGLDLRELLFPEPGEEEAVAVRLERPSLNTAALFAMSQALSELWISWGIRPQAMIGHSLGEYVAACVAGALSLESAVALVVERGRIFDAMPLGGMLSVPLPESSYKPLLGSELAVAAVNGPGISVVSGPVAAIEKLERSLLEQGVEARRIPISVAAHSHMLDPALDGFARFVERLPLRPPAIPYISCVTGTWITADEATDPMHWVRHLRQTVRFAEGIATLRREPGRVFLEVGPGKTLVSLLRDQVQGEIALASLQDAAEQGSDLAALLRCLGSLWLHGVRPDWSGVHAGEDRRRVPLPSYAFERNRYWIDAVPEGSTAPADPWQRRPDPGDWLWISSWQRMPQGRRAAASPGECSIVVEDETTMGGLLAERLSAAGQRVVTVARGEDFGRTGELSFVMDLSDRLQAATLWGELAGQGLTPRRLVWLRSVAAEPAGDRGAVRGVLAVARHLESLEEGSRPSFTLVVGEAHEVTGGECLGAERGALVGAVRALAERRLRTRILDVGPCPSGPSTQLADRIVAELLADRNETEIAFRGPHRWVHSIEPLRVDETPSPGGAFLVVGADGEVRSLLAEALRLGGARVACADPPVGEGGDLLAAVRGLGGLEGLLYIAPEPPSSEAGRPQDPFLWEEIERLSGLDRLAESAGARFLLTVSLLADAVGRPRTVLAGAQRDLVSGWVQDAARSLDRPWRGIVLENLPSSPGGTWSLPVADEMAQVLSRVAALEPGAWVTVSTGDLPGRIADWRAGATEEGRAAAARPVSRTTLYPRPDLDTPYVAPRDKIEQDLAEIWQDLLGIERVGVLDSYFDLGGDSVTSIQIVARANRVGYKLTQRKAYQHPTIAELAKAAFLDTRVHAQQSAVEGPVLLTPIQHWFFEQDLSDPHHWNLTMLLASDPPLEAGPLERAVRTLLEHHDALRLRYSHGPEGWQQVSAAPGVGPGPFTCIDLSALPPNARGAALAAAAGAAQGSLDLAGPLARFVLFRRDGGAGDRLLVAIHHLVVDAVGWRILLEDLELTYGQALHGEPLALPSKTTSFKHWAITLREHARSGALEGEKEYWLDERWERVQPLPVDLPGGSNESRWSRLLTLTLPAEETQALQQEVTRTLRADMNEILLTALAQTLAGWTSGTKLLIDLEALGREPLRDELDLSRTVGWFTNSYPLLLELPEEPESAFANLERVQGIVRAVPGRGIGYGLLRYLAGQEEVSSRLRSLPQPELAFLYFGQMTAGSSAGRFQTAPEPGGPPRSPRGQRGRLLNVSALVLPEGLQMTWSYSEALHHRATIEGLARTFFDKLWGFIELSRVTGEQVAPAVVQMEESWSN